MRVQRIENAASTRDVMTRRVKLSQNPAVSTADAAESLAADATGRFKT